ncbi:hypothetical protein ZOSMA_197G00040 [Zostera marina]|uniref:Uncharacterized protein n=1 Tax=Zostera marina TaxID=29655 RepID=A0A0K9PNU4_ZOSMR|nr:hypothetical protein ZOSMA_197G00040 [Zostera marina]
MCRTWEVLTCHSTSTKEDGGDLQKQNLPLSSLPNMTVFIVSGDEDGERGGAPVVYIDDVFHRLNSSKFQTGESSSTWAPVLLLVSLVLGLDKVSPRSRTKNTPDQVSLPAIWKRIWRRKDDVRIEVWEVGGRWRRR